MALLTRRTAVLAAIAVAVASVFALLLLDAGPGQPEGLEPLSVHASDEEGARALALWLEQLGFQPVAIEWRAFAVDADVDALLVLEPALDFSASDIVAIEDWVASGGVLIMAGESSNALTSAFEVGIVPGNVPGTAVPAQPVFAGGAAEFEPGSVATLRLDAPDWASLAVLDDSERAPVVAVRPYGAGRVYALAGAYLPSNDGLAKADNWQVAAAIFSGLPRGARVAFDEYHHGATEHGTFSQRLLREPWGWATLYLGTVLFAYFAAHGRRFGPALPELPDPRRRSRAEYVRTIAAMLRAGRHDAWLATRYAEQLKRDIGRRFRTQSDVPANDLAARLAPRLRQPDEFARQLAELERGSLQREPLLAAVRALEEQREDLLGTRRRRP